ncbi:hypothetical protein [Phaeobacter sp. B1627]|uniref:hypothetical protein n=1 Tax=Phaeobacter sp. B1627 TaxID=2583809 RepID=UPI001118FFEB|nr:hypothetical protein [Phaeobacter sp. B1627]TNJ40492.1 hypothetical protein FGE21_17910 [Phaeobacter sp. B1627]
MSERDDLKARAAELKLDFAPNLSTAKLAELVAEAEAAPSGDDGGNAFEDALAGVAASRENAEQSGGTDTAEPAFHGRKFLRVVGPEKGFRRAGRKFGADPVDIPLDELSADQELALKRERRLITSIHVEGVSD